MGFNWVRASLAGVAVLHGLSALLTILQFSQGLGLQDPLLDSLVLPYAGVMGLILVVDLARRARPARAAAGSAFVAAALLAGTDVALAGKGAALSDLAAFLLVATAALSILGPLAYLWTAHAARRDLLLAGAAGAAMILLGGSIVVGQAISRLSPGPTAWDRIAGPASPLFLAVVLAQLGFAAAVLLATRGLPADALPGARPRTSWVFGVATLAYSWLVGGRASGFAPVWWIPVFAFTIPSVADARTRRTRALVSVALFAIALLPVWPVNSTIQGDIAGESPIISTVRATLAEILGSGFAWTRTGGFNVQHFASPTWVIAVALVWLSLASLLLVWPPWRGHRGSKGEATEASPTSPPSESP